MCIANEGLPLGKMGRGHVDSVDARLELGAVFLSWSKSFSPP